MAEVLLKNVRKSFGKVETIHGVNLEIRDREFVVFVGPSGCGKSTLLRLIAGLEDITSGDLLIDGKRVNALPPAKRGISMVFQSYALYPHMTVFENIAFGLRLAGGGDDAVKQAVEKAAGILELTPLLDRLPKDLSGGQRQRVAIGRAIVRDPKVFLFDEPLSNLDAALRVQTRIEIAKLHQDMAATMIYVTHDQVEAMTLADKIVVLRAGEVEQVGAPLRLYHHPRNLFVAGFIGSPQMNFIKTRATGTGPDGVRCALPGGGEVTARVSAEGVVEGEPVTLGIRPEHMGAANGGVGVEGKVDVVEQLGESHLMHVVLPDGQRMIARAPGDAQAREGGQAVLGLDGALCHLFRDDGLACARLS
ncbi:ABC transporter ATP-binding protein [Rubrimonas cliftonensis]|uniref:Multiple sugar transport system ATP-binding protein/multiple sugar transport system ATP-binding protein n=1 Tax=Rubrimonas cliftonensis TaxID=89524 RepID=A0A1H3WQJ1_9RHOB|nr:sn-glycerol-3-phosphate ABC transporter ATP-binding protein UgpC [Rubrimonas cliftonensis]SDZ88652.1 multiple sugar transport system ATP-binding protein/multiple sugar transport system ATP-binding protein [Rubrimonas cliftonensis]